jgi:hypothetical protein
MTDRTTAPRAHHFKVYPSRADWLADRSATAPDGGPSIGASDVASIFGCGFRSPAETAAIMRGVAPKEPESDDPMNPLNVGNRLEATALEEYELLYNSDEDAPLLWTDITRWTHPDHPWLSVSPDAILTMPSAHSRLGYSDDQTAVNYGAAVGLVECKIPRGAWALGSYAPDLGDEDGAGYGIAATLADPDGPAAPRKYALQVLAQLGVLRACGAPVGFCDVWVWPGPHDHRRVRLMWDDGADAAFAALIAALADWRQRYVIEGQPHPITCADDAAIAVRYWSAEGQHEAPGLAATAARYADLGARIKALEAEQAAIKAILLTAAQRAGADRLIIPDPNANPLASKKADLEGRPAKITISRGIRVTSGWLADAAPSTLAHDPSAPIEPIIVRGVTVAELRDDAADAASAPAAALPADLLAALASDIGNDW